MGTISNLKNQVKVKNHVTSLLVYIKTFADQKALEDFALECGTTTKNLQQIAYGGSVSAKLAKAINEKSGGKISLSDLRPDIFS